MAAPMKAVLISSKTLITFLCFIRFGSSLHQIHVLSKSCISATFFTDIPAGTQRWNNVNSTLIQRRRWNTQRWNNVVSTLIQHQDVEQRRFNVESTSRRWINVESTLFQRCVPAGIAFSFNYAHITGNGEWTKACTLLFYVVLVK